jgi:hypothetical protein
MKETSAIQEILQLFVVTFISITICSIGGYGHHMMTNDQTTEAWRIWGAFLFFFIIILPTAGFWSKQLRKLFNLED